VLRNKKAIISCVLNKTQAQLLYVISTVYLFGFFPDFIERGQQHCGEDGDDRDHDEQFD
jgi:hypothetical protein